MTWFAVPLTFDLVAADELAAQALVQTALEEIESTDLNLETRFGSVATVASSSPSTFTVTAELIGDADSAAEARQAVAEACARAEQRRQTPTPFTLALGEATETADPRLLDADMQKLVALATARTLEQIDDDLELLTSEGSLSFADTIYLPDLLPAVYEQHYTPLLLAQWRASVAAVGPKLASYPDSYLASTAEELAGHAIVGSMKELLREYADGGSELQNAFSDSFDYRQAQELLDEIHELAFEDWDVIELFDPEMDGFGEEGDAIGEQLGTANLHVSDWFKPFRVDGPEPDAAPAPSVSLDI